MGLDQTAFTRLKGHEDMEIACWRKHNRLQGWMERLWKERGSEGGTDTICGENSFNCVDLRLTEDDIDALEEAINNRDLPETGGFFFGTDSYESYEDTGGGKWKSDAERDREFITAARKALHVGLAVFYSCWW